MTETKQRIHFIAIGGSVMHNLAIALHHKGHLVSGSDDEIYEPAKGKLSACGLLPTEIGWHANRIDAKIDAVILGMHAKKDNPELLKAQELGIQIYSYPEFIYQHSQTKKRVVIGGSHGKTSITSMIMHVLHRQGIDFDYLLGASIKGFENNVKLTDAPLIIIEGDEYLSSPLDLRPKFLHYHQHIGLISGIAWDHINVYPDFEVYKKQFLLFANQTVENGYLCYFDDGGLTTETAEQASTPQQKEAYSAHPYEVRDGIYYLKTPHGDQPLLIFGAHNMQNLMGSLLICKQLGIADQDFYKAIGSFEGAGKRLQLLREENEVAVFKDFAHAPSKVKASVTAAKERNPERKLIAILELHTFSSLHPDFIGFYAHTCAQADELYVYINPHNLKLNTTDHLNKDNIKKSFAQPSLRYFNDVTELLHEIRSNKASKNNYLWMSSGNFANTDLEKIALELTEK